jgi:adenylate cyclase
MPKEIERKFLLNEAAWNALQKPAGVHYRQGYILSEESRTIRARVAGTKGYITLKGKAQGISRDEFEYEIPVHEAEEILTSFARNGTEKTRYRISNAGHIWEVDVFTGDNEGLIVAEIELGSEDETFAKPEWIAQEVTDDTRYYNSNLAVHPFKHWNDRDKR